MFSAQGCRELSRISVYGGFYQAAPQALSPGRDARVMGEGLWLELRNEPVYSAPPAPTQPARHETNGLVPSFNPRGAPVLAAARAARGRRARRTPLWCRGIRE